MAILVVIFYKHAMAILVVSFFTSMEWNYVGCQYVSQPQNCYMYIGEKIHEQNWGLHLHV